MFLLHPFNLALRIIISLAIYRFPPLVLFACVQVSQTTLSNPSLINQLFSNLNKGSLLGKYPELVNRGTCSDSSLYSASTVTSGYFFCQSVQHNILSNFSKVGCSKLLPKVYS